MSGAQSHGSPVWVIAGLPKGWIGEGVVEVMQRISASPSLILLVRTVEEVCSPCRRLGLYDRVLQS